MLLPFLSILAAGAPAAGDKETAVAAVHPGLFERRGAELRLKNGAVFTDSGDCRSLHCDRYRADAVWHGRYVGVAHDQYEGGSYFLVDTKQASSHADEIAARPILSPSGRRFFAGHHSDMDWSPYQGAAIWEFNAGTGADRLRVVDTRLLMFDSFVAWRGDGCVEFKGARGYGEMSRPTRTYWLVEQGGDWRLLEARAPSCR